jgi:multiple sugar transport system ATP-binding protein
MGRAIVRSPKAFLMDEPLSNLDAKLRVQMRTSVARLQDQLGVTMVYVTHDQTEAMTLGDRVAIMRAGILQQVDSPMNLYNKPNNLFVAGFIGSPSMNFLPATVEGDKVKLPMVEITLPPARREAIGRVPEGKALIAGIRPEDFEDAGVVGGNGGATFDTRIDVLEAMGSEFYAHFTIDAPKGDMQQSEELRELQEDAGGEAPGSDGFDIVARLDQTSTARPKENAKIWVNTEKVQLFDPESGKNLAVA